MNVLFFGDLHNNKEAAELIVKKAESADLVVCTGDLSIAGEGFGEIARILSKIKKTILIIPGNNETPEFVSDGIKEYKNMIMIHGEVYEDKNTRFLGLGGGSISPWNTPYELTDEDFENILKKDYGRIDVLVSHTPPKGTVLDEVKTGLNIGSFSIGRWIKNKQPKYCATGHVHEAAGKEARIGTTLCFNPGSKGRIIKI